MKNMFNYRRFYIVLVILSCIGIEAVASVPQVKSIKENNKLIKSAQLDKTDCEVGEIPISSGLSTSGGKTYSIPFNFPAGLSERATPTVGLSYNSQQGDGFCGRGWSIAGMSAITRTGKSFYFEGRTDCINLDNGDGFLMDGNKLIKPTSKDSTTVYQTEQGNVKAVAHNHSYGRYDYFTVYYPDGAKAKYGIEGTYDAVVFPIVELTDSWGNKIHYEYQKRDGLYLLSKITYSDISVAFTYIDNPNSPLSVFSGGIEVKNDRLLESISFMRGASDIGTYSLKYVTSHNHNLLDKVSYACLNKRFNPLKFTYGDNESQLSYLEEKTELPDYIDADSKEVRYIQGKFCYGTDNDGLICLPSFNPYYGLGRDTNGIEMFKNQCSETQKIPVYTSIDGDRAETRGILTAEKGLVDILCADISGTQEEYIIKINNYPEFSHDHLYFTVYDMSQIGGIQRKSRFYYEFFPEESSNSAPFKFRPKDFFSADFDGDGRMEILAIASNQPGNKSTKSSRCYVFDLNDGDIKYSGFPFDYLVDRVATETADAWAAYNNSDRLFPVDINGDGRHELCHITGGAADFYGFDTHNGDWTLKKLSSLTELGKWNISDRELIPCDMNGDGLTDLVLSPKNDNSGYSWTVYFSKGDGSFHKRPFNGPKNNSKADYNGFMFQDMNGDGLPDLISYTESCFSVYENSPALFVPGSPGSFKKRVYYTSGQIPRLVPVCMSSRNTFTRLMSVYKNKVTRYTPKNVVFQLVCTGMINSLGVIEHNYYTSASDTETGLCTMGTGAVYPYMNLFEGLMLLAESQTYLDGNLLGKTSYAYDNPVIHRHGLGFSGFSKVYSTDMRGRTTMQTFNPYMRGIMTEEHTPTSESKFEYELNYDEDKLLTINMKSSTVKDKLKNTSVSTTNTFDGYGNILASKTTYNGGNYVAKTYRYDNNAVPADGYHIGYHTDESETVYYNGDTHVSRVAVPSHTRGSPLKRVTYSNGVVVKTEEFQYDSHGLVVKATEKAWASPHTQTSTFAYDSLGRVVSKTDPLGRTNTYAYNKSGQLERETDFQNQYIQYSYDEFGREKMRYVPEPGPTYTSYSWSKIGEPGLYCKSVSPQNRHFTHEYFDALNRSVAVAESRFDGSLSYTATNYDMYGRVKSESLPYLKGKSPDKWTEYTYDSYDRVTRIDYPSGAYASHSYNGLSETVEENQIATTTVYDAMGRTLSVTDPSGKVTYSLRADGQPDKITSPGGVETLFEYDTAGRLTLRHDPSEGNTTFTYDNGGNTSSVTDARGKTISYEYDNHDRPTVTRMPEMTVTDTYDPSTGYLIRRESSKGHSLSMAYDSHGRVTKSVEAYGDVSLEKTHTYLHGDLYKTVYKSHRGFTETETFTHNFGHLISVAISDGTKIFERKAVNALGQTTQSLHGPITTDYGYDEYGAPTGRTDRNGNASVASVAWDFDPYTGNLLSRTDLKRNITERFGYDGLNRLTSYGGCTVEYGSNGNILAKSDAGTFSYTSAEKPYAITRARFSDPALPSGKQTVTYASFRRPLTLKEGSATATFTYGAGLDRLTMRLRADGTTTTRHYLGGCYEYDYSPYLAVGLDANSSVLPPAERDTTAVIDPTPSEIAASRIERLYLGGDAYTAPAVMVKTGSKADDVKLYFIVRDYLGSILALVDRDGKAVQELSYDAWGRLRDPDTHALYDMGEGPELLLGRGYCGHEHLAQFGLINMNARLYDPVLGRFLSPDPYVQDPAMPQNFNRYSYCLNNPLCYVDKDGEIFFTAITATIDLFRNIVKHGVNFRDYSFKRTENAWNIDKGMFQGNVGQIINKWTWGLFNSLVGNITAHYYNIAGKVDKVTHMDGMLALSGPSPGNSAFTIGHYSFGPRGYRADWRDHLFVHEYGHYIQSQILGPIYLKNIALPSLISAAIGEKLTGIEHSSRWFEVMASCLGAKHFDHKYGRGAKGYDKKSPEYFDIDSFRNNVFSPYINPRDGSNNKSGHPIYKFSLTWLDFYFPFF